MYKLCMILKHANSIIGYLDSVSMSNLDATAILFSLPHESIGLIKAANPVCLALHSRIVVVVGSES